MGISSHQVRLMQLTDRKHDIGRDLCRLANDKLELTRDMNEASKEYQEGLRAKTLKWSPNSGITYYDLSYKNLMRPGMMNKNTAYLLTDSSDRVVIDYDYQKYAQMISPNGQAGGNWDANRSKILSELVGVPESTINGVDASSATVEAALAELDAVKAKKPKIDFKETKKMSEILEEYLGKDTGASQAKFKGADDWKEAYTKAGKINLGSNKPADILSNVGSRIANGLASVFVTESSDFNAEKSPIHDIVNGLVTGQSAVIAKDEESSYLSKDGNDYHLDVNNFINTIISELQGYFDCKQVGDDYNIEYYNTKSDKFKNYKTEKANWEANLSAAQAKYDSAVSSDNALLTADQETQIDFYDDLFSTIAEKGWTYNANVNDEDYLNQMLQNNLYTITTVESKRVKSNEFTEDYFWENIYKTDIASNMTNIFAVNDTEARNDAQVEYERKKAVINAKENKIDTRMQNLKTEQDAINTMIQSIQSILDENIDEKFSIFS